MAHNNQVGEYMGIPILNRAFTSGYRSIPLSFLNSTPRPRPTKAQPNRSEETESSATRRDRGRTIGLKSYTGSVDSSVLVLESGPRKLVDGALWSPNLELNKRRM